MASATGEDNKPFLPPEIYVVIAQYVHRNDLPNYRLASRVLAGAGKPELFNTIVLRSTIASVSALRQIIQNTQLSTLVRTFIWDVNAWRVGPNVRDWHEWTRHCEARAKGVDSDQAARYKELSTSRQHWEAYLSRVEEEKAALQDIWVLLISDETTYSSLRLPNLQTVHMVKGAYQLNNGRVYWSQEQHMLPVTRPLGAWRGDAFSRSVNMILLSAIFLAASDATKWRFDGFTTLEHAQLTYASRSQGKYLNVTSLEIRCRASTSPHPVVANSAPFCGFIERWPNLESLDFDLDSRTLEDDLTASIRTIQDIFEMSEDVDIRERTPVGVTWPKLRRLSLGHFNSSPRALYSLVTRHSSTLRELRLHVIWLDDTEDNMPLVQHYWRAIFGAISASTNLEKVALSGIFRNNRHEDDVWDFDNKMLSRAVAGWIINGGECPLTEELKGIREV